MPQLDLAIQKFLNHCQYVKSLSPHTVRAYQIDLQDFQAYCGQDLELASASSATIEAYIEHVRRRNLSAATAKRRLGCLKVFFKWAEDGGILITSPLTHLKLSIKLPHRLPKAINRNELKKLVISAESRPFRNGTDMKLAIMVMATTGIRVAELTMLRTADVDVAEGRIRIQGKGNRERTVFVTNRNLLVLLKRYVLARQDFGSADAPLFTNRYGAPLTTGAFRARLRKICEQSSLAKHITPHMLRHTAATLLIEEGVDIRVVQRLLGHQSISTTEIYTHVSDQTLRKALTRADLAGHLV